MTGIYLQRMLENVSQGSLPSNWTGFDLATFSRGKVLWDYQQQALQNALLALWKYYQIPGQPENERKQAYMTWYRDFGLEEDLDLPLDRSSAAKRKLAALLETYYRQTDDRMSYEQFINRMCFWMATGSGKTLVIVKLIELLHHLMQRGEIPRNDILILAHRDDLLEQLRTHVDEFNTSGELFIRLHELRDYAEVKQRQSPSLLRGLELNIFYYRSNNLSDERKDKTIDFRNYDNNGNWYILLDEAHKGDKEDSKRQHIYSILSRNGFLFNFSATFTDSRDIITTAFDFNLSRFIPQGFGKHIFVFGQETTAFRSKKEFTEPDKQKIVLMALIMLALSRLQEQRVRSVEPSLYHRPLLMTLVNSVNTQDADLKMFFRELARIGKGEIEEAQWQAAKNELRAEFGQRPTYMYEGTVQVQVADRDLEDITQDDLRKQVFNSGLSGEIEVLIRPSDRQEVALKLKTSDVPFALIRIGDISDWLTKELKGYEINNHFNEESFFERLNKDGSDINMLLGSRSFYEGWDSNRPNVIMYINIGVGLDAKKFILQSVGRGARIEPLKDKRKRFAHLKTGGLLTSSEVELFEQVKQDILLLESEFIFGTNREALETVIEGMKQEDAEADYEEISLSVNIKEVSGKLLLVPVFRQQNEPLPEKKNLAKFALSSENLSLVESFLEYVEDDRVLMALYNAKPKQVRLLRKGIQAKSEHFRTDGPNYKNLDVLVNQVFRFSNLYGIEIENFKPLEEEINHFKHIRLFLPRVEFERFENLLQTYAEKPKKIEDLRARYDSGQLSFEDMLSQAESLGQADCFNYDGMSVNFLRIAKHYYLPILTSNDDKIEYIRNIIKVPSEVSFLNKLESYLKDPGNKFSKLDWWLFSRVDEACDQINIPYYNPYENKISNFKPDFVFWFQNGSSYHILFVDPKGTSRTEYEHKVDGFRELFEDQEKPRQFTYGNLTIQLHLALFTSDRAWTSEYYRRFWLDQIDNLFKGIA